MKAAQDRLSCNFRAVEFYRLTIMMKMMNVTTSTILRDFQISDCKHSRHNSVISLISGSL